MATPGAVMARTRAEEVSNHAVSPVSIFGGGGAGTAIGAGGCAGAVSCATMDGAVGLVIPACGAVPVGSPCAHAPGAPMKIARPVRIGRIVLIKRIRLIIGLLLSHYLQKR